MTDKLISLTGLKQFFTKLKDWLANNFIKQSDTSNVKVKEIWSGTEAEYNAIPTKSPNTLYIIPYN